MHNNSTSSYTNADFFFFPESAALPSAQNGWCSIKEIAIQYYPHSSVFSLCLICHSSPALEPETSSQAFSYYPRHSSESVSVSSPQTHNTHDFTEGELRSRAINCGVWQQHLAPRVKGRIQLHRARLFRQGSKGAKPAMQIMHAGPQCGRSGRKIKKMLLECISTETPKHQPHLGGKLHSYVML